MGRNAGRAEAGLSKPRGRLSGREGVKAAMEPKRAGGAHQNLEAGNRRAGASPAWRDGPPETDASVLVCSRIVGQAPRLPSLKWRQAMRPPYKARLTRPTRELPSAQTAGRLLANPFGAAYIPPRATPTLLRPTCSVKGCLILPQPVFPIIRMTVSVSYGCDPDYVPVDNVRDVTRENGAIYPPITGVPFAPEEWVTLNCRANLGHLNPKSLAQTGLPRFIKQCGCAQLALRLGRKLKPHFLRASSSSAKTSSAEIDFDLPSLNSLILRPISRSQASSISALMGGSSVERMR